MQHSIKIFISTMSRQRLANCPHIKTAQLPMGPYGEKRAPPRARAGVGVMGNLDKRVSTILGSLLWVKMKPPGYRPAYFSPWFLNLF